MNALWMILIIIMLILSIIIGKHINFDNFKIIKIFKIFKNKNKKGLFLTLGTKIGVGSIIGTAISIYVGGPGSVLWIVLFSFITSSLIYYESYIGSKYKEKVNNNYLSGPYFYIKKGLQNKWLAIVSMIILILCYSLFFQMIQTNTIKDILYLNFGISKNIICIVVIIIILFLIFFSIEELISSMNKLVPIMCTLYILLGLQVIFKNFSQIDNIFYLIVSSAFTKRGLIIGSIIGIKRAIFLNEIMIGTTSIGSGVDNNNKEDSALLQTFGMYFITFVISLLTSILILLFEQNNIITISNYNELITNVFKYNFGSIGPFLLTIIMLLFAITTIISGYYIGTTNLSVITKSKKAISIFKIFVLLFCIGGIYIDSNNIWKYIDILMYVLIVINIYSLFKIYRGEKSDR